MSKLNYKIELEIKNSGIKEMRKLIKKKIMKRQLRAMWTVLFIKARTVKVEKKSLKNPNSKMVHNWKVKLRWYSPAVWIMFILTLVRGLFVGAVLGVVGVVKSTFEPRPATHSIELKKGEKIKWYMYYA